MIIDDVHRGIHGHKQPKRVGRGCGSGHGKTSGRGHKGQGSRRGAASKIMSPPSRAESLLDPIFRLVSRTSAGAAPLTSAHACISASGISPESPAWAEVISKPKRRLLRVSRCSGESTRFRTSSRSVSRS